jgi:hypothetical protein
MPNIVTEGCNPCSKCGDADTIYLTEGVRISWFCKNCRRIYYTKHKPIDCNCGENKFAERRQHFGPICYCQKCKHMFESEAGKFDLPDDSNLDLLYP